jgi:hypothetical protein
MLRRGAGQALSRLNEMHVGEWELDPLDWDAPLEKLFESWPHGDMAPKELYGAYFPMPGAAVMAIFTVPTAAALIQAYVAAAGAAPSLIMECEALGEIANILVTAVSGILAETCHFFFFLPSPQVFLAPQADLLTKMRHAGIQLQGPGQEPALLTRITLRSGDFECQLAVLLGMPWCEFVKVTEKPNRR